MKIIKWLDDNFEVMVCSIALVGLFLAMILSVFFRYVLNSSLTWVEEVGCYLFVWFSLVGVGYSTKTRAHLRVDILVNLAPPPLRKFLDFIANLSMTLFFLYMSVEGMKAIQSIVENGTTSPALRMPMWILYISFWLGCVMSLVRLIQAGYKTIIGSKQKLQEGASDVG